MNITLPEQATPASEAEARALLLAQAQRLPMLPAVVTQLIPTLQDEQSDLRAIAQLVRQDPALAARVLRAANAGRFGRTPGSLSIDQALMRLGFSELRALLLAAGLAGAFGNVPKVDLNGFWTHSAATARLAQHLSGIMEVEPDVGYTAGLLHGVGWLLLMRTFPEFGGMLVAGWSTGGLAAQLAIEKRLAGIDHCAAGALLGRFWSFPPLISDAIAHYGNAAARDHDPLALLVWIASMLVRAAQRPAGTPDPELLKDVQGAMAIAQDEIVRLAGSALDRAWEDVRLFRD